MNINEYQEAINNYKPYKSDIGIFYNLIDISSAVGDLNKKVNTILANDMIMNRELALKLSISIGDILCAISNFSSDIGLTMEDIATLNLKKIQLQKEKEVKNQNNNPIKIE